MIGNVSVIVPSLGCEYLKYLLIGLRDQTTLPKEVIIVAKNCNLRDIEKLCNLYSLNCLLIEQKYGSFTDALNIGKREASGDILVFVDEDVILPPKWIQRYAYYHRIFPNIAGINSRDVYFDLKRKTIERTPDDDPLTRIYRYTVRIWLEQPHDLFKKYRFGIYLTKNIEIAHGPFVPYRLCYSLPFRGVNMSFKAEMVYDCRFPQHPMLKHAPRNEIYFGIQIKLRGYDMIFIPDNPILHIKRKSLSRSLTPRERKEWLIEWQIIRALIAKLLQSNNKETCE